MKKSAYGLALLCATLAGVFSFGRAAEAAEPVKVTQVLSWFAQPEMGGHYAALSAGLYKKAGLDVTLQQGGPQVAGIQLLLAGQAMFAMAQADEVVLARKEGIPLVAIYGTLQTNPQCLIYHKDGGISKIGDLNGRKVYVATGFPYWEYFLHKYDLGKAIPQAYTGSLAAFSVDKSSVTQGYLTNEPYVLKQQGIEVAAFSNADLGYNPYGNVVVTTEENIKKYPEVIAAYLKATSEGWTYYADHSTEVNAEINAANPEYKPDHLAYAFGVAKPFVFGGDAETHGVGYMSKERWTTLVGQLAEVGLVDKSKIDVAALYTNEFVPAK